MVSVRRFSTMSAPPTEDEWHSEQWCLDAEAAYEVFSGKSLDEALSMFAEDALNRQEDLMFMPAICFRFYLPAYLSYLASGEAKGDCDGASCVFELVDHRLDDLLLDADLLRQTAEAIAYVGGRQEWYGAPTAIYGSFHRKADRLLRKITNRQ